jgi:amidase
MASRHRQDSIVSTQEVTTLAIKSGLSIPPSELEDWSVLLSGLNHCAKEVLTLNDYTPEVNPALYPRTDIHRPVGPTDTDHGGWAWKCDVRSTNPTSDELAGRTIAIKDNIAVAGVKCTNGTGGKVGDWVPKVDATLVTRLLDAGGIIKGKAACENNCFGAVRYTSPILQGMILQKRLTDVGSTVTRPLQVPLTTPMHMRTQQVAPPPAQLAFSPLEQWT